ncbi:Transcription factor bHLH111 [Platanthera guangdongensis]|uniref:Transcription factor bHLH111 n=1 Tax=Platanthera guangdongensis TaxID=2320717 RepID=A0ABR2MNW5_9ASPA
MAQDEAAGSSEASVASSSPAACWWDTIPTTNSSSILMSSSSSAACSWNAPAMINNHGRHWKLPPDQLAASNSCNIDDDDQAPADISISTNSFTNPSTTAGSGDHSESHLWNQLLLGSEVGNSQGMQQISSHQKNIMRSTLMFDEAAACDYLKKLEGSNWDQLTSNMNSSADDISSSCSSLLEKQLIRGGYNENAGGELGHHNSESSRLITCSSLMDLSLQAPKVKVGDKITALQQLVSPFGKTDTASVLLEAIKYIRFLQEQVQDHMISSWPASMERKEKADPKHDLRGRGLCLVPISCTPQAYRENSGPDFWTPPFRGCLYR